MAPLTAVKLPVLSVLSGDLWQPLRAVVGGIAARLARRLRERQQRRCFRSPTSSSSAPNGTALDCRAASPAGA